MLKLITIWALLFMKKGDLEGAIDSYKQALKIKPDYADAYFGMGNALKDKGDLDAAIDSYKQALKIKPDFADAYNNMGNVLHTKNDYEAAIDSFKQLINLVTARPTAEAGGYANFELGNYGSERISTAIIFRFFSI